MKKKIFLIAAAVLLGAWGYVFFFSAFDMFSF